MPHNLAASELFDDPTENVDLGDGAMLLRGFALAIDREILGTVAEIAARSPFRHMVTPGGWQMSVAMTNCGALGWITDRTGYRYDPDDPDADHS
jgi:DNA oxidative demethylase